MTEPAAAGKAAGATPAGAGADDGTAGALLRAERSRQGMHIAMLAASIKVPQAKLEALEAGRYDALPDATFTRALALSVCRVLKIDPAPVLSSLPGVSGLALDKVDGGLNTPFRDRPGRIDPADWALSRKAVGLVVLVLLVAAGAIWLQPARVPLRMVEAAAEPTAASASTAANAGPLASAGTLPSPVTEPAPAGAAAPAASGSTPPAAGPAPTPVPAAPSGQALNLRATQDSWVSVSDGQGRSLLSRQLGAGEAVDLDGEPPFRLRIGNVRGTEIRFRGAVVDLAATARANVATLTLP